MSWTLCTSGAAVFRAGTNANSTIVTSGAALEVWSDNAEGKICAECHTDFVTNYSTLTSQIKNALSEVSSALVGQDIVEYDISSYPQVREAETILDFLDDRITKGLAILKQKVNQRFST